MDYKEIQPGESLLSFVKLFWQFANTTPFTKQYTILPDGYFDLIIKVTDSELIDVSLYGICTKQIDVTIPANTKIIGVTFKPIAAECFFQQPIADILNSSKVLDNSFWNFTNTPVHDFTEFVGQASTEIIKKLSIDGRKIKIFDLLFLSHGSLTVNELSDKANWASRQINRYFKSQFGLPLKTYATILRCSASYTSIRAGQPASSGSYYDQSHFIKEIKKYTGSVPKELRQNKNDRFLQFLTLPKA